jgi:histidinol dehydrogenase
MAMRVLEYGKDDLKAVMSRAGVDYHDIWGIVGKIVDSVKSGGDDALREWTKKLDGVGNASIRIAPEELEAAYERTEKAVINALETAHMNIKAVHKAQLGAMKKEWTLKVAEGVLVGERMTPIMSVGCYVPGGRASYPSTVLMTATPAKMAGVKRVVVASPPRISDTVLAACRIAGVDEVYQAGGAQAIAALAYGTETIAAVSKIVGPGNRYVTAAKMQVYGQVAVDMPAGPSEILVIADGSADPVIVAADVLAQAEHDPAAQCVVATDSKRLAEAVAAEVERGANNSGRREILGKSLENFTILMTASTEESVRFANDYAPEHLEIHTAKPGAVAEKILNAGAIFIGPYSAVAAGDYASGGNHVLPTSGAAKYSGQLSVRDFLKSTSIQRITRDGLKKLAPSILALAQQEGLTEHRKSIEKRL